jgi:hypothetical protein
VTDSVAVVSTSINFEPLAYAEWAKQGDLIVVGDKNSPRELESFVTSLGGRYITPDKQDVWSFTKRLPWNCIQRRNVAVMQAYADRYDFVVTVDDDNWPDADDWVAQHIAHIKHDFPTSTSTVTGWASSNGEWVDTGRFVTPPTKQRGTPFGVVTRYSHDYDGSWWPDVVVSVAQVLGTPDCDAVTRLTSEPNVLQVTHNVIVDRMQWAAFNSQATVWRGDWAPMICCLPYVGRYDDIIASFIAKRIMMDRQVSIYVGEPTVTQDRNPHDYVKDLREEVFGLEVTPRLIKSLTNGKITGELSLAQAWRVVTENVRHHLPPETNAFIHEWYSEWRAYERDRERA